MNDRHHLSLTPGSPCTALRDLLPAYAAGSVTPEEANFVQQMLGQCPEAAQELADYYQLFDLLPNILPAPEGSPLPASQLLIRLHSQSAAPPVPPRTHTHRQRTPPLWLLYSAAALFLFLCGATNLFWLLQLETLRSEQRVLQAEQTRIAQASGIQIVAANPSAVPTRSINTATPAPALPGGESEHRVLVSTSGLANMEGTVAWDPLLGTGSLFVRGMPEAPSDHVYQLWLMGPDSAPLSLGTFSVNPEGDGVLVFALPEPVERYTQIGISLEPGTGSEEPTTPNLAEGAI